MTPILGKQTIKQLEKRKGGYFYLKLDASVVKNLSKKNKTRIICIIDSSLSIRCGLNHLGDGNFYIILGGKYLKTLHKELGDEVEYLIKEDPDQLGVDIPEVLTVLLEQDAELKAVFNKITDGKKRSLIYSFNKIKNIDRQVAIIIEFLLKEK